MGFNKVIVTFDLIKSKGIENLKDLFGYDAYDFEDSYCSGIFDAVFKEDHNKALKLFNERMAEEKLMDGLNSADAQYSNLIKDILANGVMKTDRTGTGTKSVHARQLRFNLSDGFPLLTTKKVFFKGIAHELLWFLKGDTNIKYLVDNGVNIWNEWPYKNYVKSTGDEITLDEYVERIKTDQEFALKHGECGPIYGKQWVDWGGKKVTTLDSKRDDNGFLRYKTTHEVGFNQMQSVIDRLDKNSKNYKPDCRRLIVSAWNPVEIDKMALPPCHMMFQFFTKPKEDGTFILDLFMYQRSCDVGLGVPFNIASYALLLQMVAQTVGMEAGEFIWQGGDVHIYKDHLEALEKQAEIENSYELPQVKLNPDVKNVFDFTYDDIELVGYKSHKSIKMAVSV